MNGNSNSGNGVYDVAILDAEDGSLIVPAEPFVDANGNGVYDLGEEFTDYPVGGSSAQFIRISVE